MDYWSLVLLYYPAAQARGNVGMQLLPKFLNLDVFTFGGKDYLRGVRLEFLFTSSVVQSTQLQLCNKHSYQRNIRISDIPQ